MKREALIIEDQDGLNELYGLLDEGYVLDPQIYEGRPLRLETSVIYHLVLYECPDEVPQEIEEQERKIVSIQSVDINDADELLGQGYEVQATYAKTVTLVKYEDSEDPFCESEAEAGE